MIDAHSDYANALGGIAYGPTSDIKVLNRAFSVADDAHDRALEAASDAYYRALEAARDVYNRALEAAGISPISSQPRRPSPGWYPDPAGTGGFAGGTARSGQRELGHDLEGQDIRLVPHQVGSVTMKG